MNKTRSAAMDIWCKGSYLNARTDYLTNQLLENIAGTRYNVYFSDDDPIYTIIGNLTNSERRKFIKGVQKIIQEAGNGKDN